MHTHIGKIWIHFSLLLCMSHRLSMFSIQNKFKVYNKITQINSKGLNIIVVRFNKKVFACFKQNNTNIFMCFFLINKHIWYLIFAGGGVTCYSYRYSRISWISLNEPSHAHTFGTFHWWSKKKTTALFYGVHKIFFTIGTTALLSIIATSRYMYNSSYCMRQRVL